MVVNIPIHHFLLMSGNDSLVVGRRDGITTGSSGAIADSFEGDSMNELEIVRGAKSINANWLLNGEYNFHMTKDAFAELVKQLNEFLASDNPYMVAY